LSGHLRNHRSGHNRPRNDAALLLSPPAPSAHHATANLRASAGPLCCFISVEHNDVHLADSRAKLLKPIRSRLCGAGAPLTENRPLRHLVFQCRDAQRPLRAVRFRDVVPAHRAGSHTIAVPREAAHLAARRGDYARVLLRLRYSDDDIIHCLRWLILTMLPPAAPARAPLLSDVRRRPDRRKPV
jgi:hypothetical protein